MNDSLIDISAFCAGLALLVALGTYRSSQVKDEGAYLVAGRHTGLFALTATLVMTEFNTSTLLSFAALGVVAGPWAVALPFVFLVGLLFYAAVAAKKWKEYDGLSVAGLFSERYGSSVGRLASGALLTAMVGFSATYVKSLAMIFAPLLGVDSLWGVSAVLVGITLLMTLRGGLVSIIRIDVVSFVLVCVLIPVLLYCCSQYGGATPVTTIPSLSEAQQMLPPSFVGSLVILTMFTYILAPWYGQKIFSAQSQRTAYLSVALAAVLVFALYGCTVLAASRFAGSVMPLSDPQTVIPLAIQATLPAGLKGLAYLVLFTAGATTLSGVWSAMTTMVVGDFLGGSRSNGVARDISITLCFAFSSYVLGNTLVDNILDRLILANIPVFALSFALLAAFYWPAASEAGAVASTVVGVAWGVATYLYFGEGGGYTWYWAVYGLPLIFGTGVVASLVRPDFKPVSAVQ